MSYYNLISLIPKTAVSPYDPDAQAFITAAANTVIILNDNISSGNLTFGALVATYPTTATLAAQMVATINASTIQITATQDSPGDSYFYLEADTNLYLYAFNILSDNTSL
jgi:hypothetical protein